MLARACCASSFWPVLFCAGERRITNFTPVGISVCEEINLQEVLKDIPAEDKAQQQQVSARFCPALGPGRFKTVGTI
jgi:hypothetical protein